MLPQTRGRYRLGPLTVDVSDPFALTRQRMEFDELDDLLVTPEIEDLFSAPDPGLGPNWGATRARQLFRTGEEYYTMRQYQLGDDLRRIHWPSVARTGDLMIRQDESSRRASGLVFLDNRGHRPRPVACAGVRAGRLGRRHARRAARPARVRSAPRHDGGPAGRGERGALPRRARRHLPRFGPLGRPLAGAPSHRRLGRHLARVRRGAAGAG